MNVLAVGALSTAFQLAWALVALVALVFLVRLYQRTQMSGFLWLLFAMVVWPFLGRLSIAFLPMLLAQGHEPILRATMISVVLTGMVSLIGGVLLMISAILLDREYSAKSAIPAAGYPNVPPTYSNVPSPQSGLPPAQF